MEANWRNLVLIWNFPAHRLQWKEIARHSNAANSRPSSSKILRNLRFSGRSLHRTNVFDPRNAAAGSASRHRKASCAHQKRLESVCPNNLHLEYPRSEEHTSELQSLMRISYAVFCLKKKT